MVLEVLGDIFREPGSRLAVIAKVIREDVGQFVVDVTLVARVVDLSFPKTPSVLSCKDLRLLVESAAYIKRTDSKDQERTEDGSSSADMSTLLSQPCSY